MLYLKLYLNNLLQIGLHKRSLHRDKKQELTISKTLYMRRTQIVILPHILLGIDKKTWDRYPKFKMFKYLMITCSNR